MKTPDWAKLDFVQSGAGELRLGVGGFPLLGDIVRFGGALGFGFVVEESGDQLASAVFDISALGHSGTQAKILD